MPQVPLRDRLPKDPEERPLRLADELDDLDANVNQQIGGLRAELREFRAEAREADAKVSAEVKQIDKNVTARLRWVTLSLFSVTGIVFTAILTYVVAR